MKKFRLSSLNFQQLIANFLLNFFAMVLLFGNSFEIYNHLRCYYRAGTRLNSFCSLTTYSDW